MIPIGSMTERVVIQSRTATADGQGGYTSSWATAYTRWAKVSELPSDRMLTDGGVKFNKVIRVECRAETSDPLTMTSEYRLSWDGKTWTVHSVTTNGGMNEIIAYTEG